MSKLTIAIVDYGMGNHASVTHSLRSLGYRVIISKKKEDLNIADLLILPGVGAFPAAIKLLKQFDLFNYLKLQASNKRPIIGICLGMHLLANASYEHAYTEGLGIIPGEVIKFNDNKFHIGWNTLKASTKDKVFKDFNDKQFYFNHSYRYYGPDQYVRGLAESTEIFPAIIKYEKVIGVQFHPEKSQISGINLLDSMIKGVVNA